MKKKTLALLAILSVLCFTTALVCLSLTGCSALFRNTVYNHESEDDYREYKRLNGFCFEVPEDDYEDFETIDSIDPEKSGNLEFISTDKNEFFVMCDERNYFVVVNVDPFSEYIELADSEANDIEKLANEDLSDFDFRLEDKKTFFRDEEGQKLILKGEMSSDNLDKTYQGFYTIVEDKYGNQASLFAGGTNSKYEVQAEYIAKSFYATNDFETDRDYDKNFEETPEVPENEKPESTPEITLEEPEQDTQLIGNDIVGTMEIPSNFIPFQDISGGDDLQYSDPGGYLIFTMNIIEGADRETMKENLMMGLTSEGALGVTGANVYVNYYPAQQVYGYYPDVEKYLVIWLIEDPIDETKVYYLAAEFDAEHADLVDYIETWSPPFLSNESSNI